MALVDVIQASLLFKGLDKAQLEKVAAISKEVSYPAGATVFKEAEPAQTLYILQEGKVVLEMQVRPGRERPASRAAIDVVTAGESLGFSVLVEPYVYTLSASCIDASKLVAIDGARLRDLVTQDHDIGYEVMRQLTAMIASRLRHTRQTLISERGLALL